MGRKGTAAAQSFALLMQGIAQGIHGLRQQQAQQEDDSRAERRLQMEEEHFRGLQEERQLNRQERGRHNLEQERLRQEAIDKARKEDRDLREMEYVLGAEKGGSSAAERGPYMDFRDLTEPLRAKGLDDKAILDALQKPGTYTFQFDPNDTVMGARLSRLNRQRKELGQPEITPTNGELTLSHSGLQALRSTTDVLSDWGASNKELDKIMERTRPPIENLGGKGIRPERLMGMLQRKRKWDEVQGQGQSAQAEQPMPAGVPEARESATRDGNLLRHRTDTMVSALLGGEGGGMAGQNPGAQMPATPDQLGRLFSTDPRHRIAAWMELHTAGYPAMPPTLDFAVDASSGTPMLKQDVFAQMEQVQPGMGQAANQMLQSLAAGQQRMQQQAGGLFQGQPIGQGQGEQFAGRATKPQSRPAQTQASPMEQMGGSRAIIREQQRRKPF